MSRKVAFAALLSVCLALPAHGGERSARSHQPGPGGHTTYVPGAPGAGDPYFPLDGNGGYDVKHYLLDLDYDPATDVLSGTATITAAQRRTCPAFNLDLDGLTVRSIKVNGRSAHWSRDGGELTVTPGGASGTTRRFTTVVTYDGVPETLGDPTLGVSGFMHTDDGAIVAGQPDVAATWFPVNDHPSDKAAYTFELAAPRASRWSPTACCRSSRPSHGWTTWTWDAKEPMASYLAMMAVGEFDVRAYREDGLRFWDALDPDLSRSRSRRARVTSSPCRRSATCPTSAWLGRSASRPRGAAVVLGQPGPPSPTGTSPSSRRTPSARTTGRRCPTSTATPARARATVPLLAVVAPVPRALPDRQRRRHLFPGRDERCVVGGAAAASDGYELWAVDLVRLRRLRRRGVDQLRQRRRRAAERRLRRRHHRLHRRGSTSFEDDGDALDGWTVPGAPAGSEANANDWIVGPSPTPHPPSARSSPGRSRGRARSSTSCRTPSAGIRSRPRAGSWTTPTSSASPSRPRPVRSTR